MPESGGRNQQSVWRKSSRTRLVLALLILVWMGVIFYFSAQNGAQSSQTSGRVVKEVIRVMYPDFSSMPKQKQASLQHMITLIVRKGAHFTEYLILGALIAAFVHTFTEKRFRMVWMAWIAGTIYAAGDELHQMFSNGRTPKLLDVCIDSSGVLCGAVLCLAAAALAVWIRRRRQK